MVRGYLLPKRKRFPLDGKVHRLWNWYAEQTYTWSYMWLWRPLCWYNGEHQEHYKVCVICHKDMYEFSK
jgi:hypothetical protein